MGLSFSVLQNDYIVVHPGYGEVRKGIYLGNDGHIQSSERSNYQLLTNEPTNHPSRLRKLLIKGFHLREIT